MQVHVQEKLAEQCSHFAWQRSYSHQNRISEVGIHIIYGIAHRVWYWNNTAETQIQVVAGDNAHFAYCSVLR